MMALNEMIAQTNKGSVQKETDEVYAILFIDMLLPSLDDPRQN